MRIWTTLTAITTAGLLSAGLSSAAFAAELLFVERAGCPYCSKWEREVSAPYQNSEEGRKAPLRRHSLEQGQPAGVLSPIRFTPTFVLMEQGREIGRITGYMDDHSFWGLLAPLMTKLEATPLPTAIRQGVFGDSQRLP
jgi:hypothetical protein